MTTLYITKIDETIVFFPSTSFLKIFSMQSTLTYVKFLHIHHAGKYADKGAFVLCKTFNPGSNDILALNLQQQTVFEKIAGLANEWSSSAASESPTSSTSPRLGLVVGATDPSALSKARHAAGSKLWVLAPGVGAQGGDLDAACRAGLNDEGTGMLIILRPFGEG